MWVLARIDLTVTTTGGLLTLLFVTNPCSLGQVGLASALSAVWWWVAARTIRAAQREGKPRGSEWIAEMLLDDAETSDDTPIGKALIAIICGNTALNRTSRFVTLALTLMLAQGVVDAPAAIRPLVDPVRTVTITAFVHQHDAAQHSLRRAPTQNPLPPSAPWRVSTMATYQRIPHFAGTEVPAPVEHLIADQSSDREAAGGLSAGRPY